MDISLRLTCKLDTIYWQLMSQSVIRSFRDKSAAALLAFTSLPPHYASTKWTALEGKIRRHALQARRRLAKPCDQDWILTILSYLRCLVALGNDSHASLALLSDLENEPRDAREEFSHISKELHSATSQLTEGREHYS